MNFIFTLLLAFYIFIFIFPTFAFYDLHFFHQGMLGLKLGTDARTKDRRKKKKTKTKKTKQNKKKQNKKNPRKQCVLSFCKNNPFRSVF